MFRTVQLNRFLLVSPWVGCQYFLTTKEAPQLRHVCLQSSLYVSTLQTVQYLLLSLQDSSVISLTEYYKVVGTANRHLLVT